MRTVISWANNCAAFTGDYPTRLLGPPDGRSYPVDDHNTTVTLQDFRPQSYAGIVDLLGFANAGDVVGRDQFLSADLISFEANGNAAGPAGGWESCDWRFSDGSRTLAFHWDTASVPPGSDGVTRDPHVVGNGSVSGSVYAAFFGIAPDIVHNENPAAPTLDDVVISFLLLRLQPEIDPTSPSLEVTMSVNGGSPDPDALGILHHRPDEPEYTRFDDCPG